MKQLESKPQKSLSTRIRGAGGKKPKNPIYTNDNLFSEDSIELLLAVGEGPLEGLQYGARSLFVGDVPLQRLEGVSLVDNFANLRTNPASVGGISRDPNLHAGLPKTVNVGMGLASPIVFQKHGESASVDASAQVLYATPVIRYTPANMRGRILALDVRVNIAQLGREDGNGTFEKEAAFRIEYKPSLDPTWQVLTIPMSFPLLPTPKTLGVRASARDGVNEYFILGKTGSGFAMDFRIILPNLLDNDDWMIRVTKNTPDTDPSAGTVKEICDIVFESFQMLGQAQRTFADTAVIHIVGTASDQFSSLPDFYGIYKGLKTPVPVGYDSEHPADPYHAVTWTGATELKYHSNPAWVLYDLLNNTRYGYRRYVSDLNLNKQDFFEAGQWCDQRVLGDNGQFERRYTMNITIAENQNAWEYLQNIAGAFDGILHDDGEGTVRLKVDKWVDPKVIFTPETIQAEGFNYSFTDVATQYNELTVSFTNPARGWEESRLKVTYDDEDNGQGVNGVVPLDFVAVGCIHESEAKRRAKARGLTASTENTLVNFTTTRLGVALDPLEIFYVADPTMGWGQSGRAEVVSGLNLYLRDALPFTVADLTTPYQMRIQTLSDILLCNVLLTSPTTLQVTSNTAAFLAASFADFPVFVLSGGRIPYGQPKPFRATNLEPSDNYNLFSIAGLEVNPKKFDILGDSQHLTLTINTKILNGLNLRQFVNNATLKPTAKYQTVMITLDGTEEDLYVIAADVNNYAFTVGSWNDGILPPGVRPKVIVKGNVKILGRGGAGGKGGGLMTIDRSNLLFTSRPSDWGFPAGNGTEMGGLAGENGGPAANFDSQLDMEVQGNLEISGGFGGGCGGDGCAVSKDEVFHHAFYSRQVVIFRLPGSGGSGGRPLGAAGQAGANGYNVPAGNMGTETAGGICPNRNSHAVSMVNRSVFNGEGHDGLPSIDNNNPTPEYTTTQPPPHGSVFYTDFGSRVNGSQGVSVTNRSNLFLSGSGSHNIAP